MNIIPISENTSRVVLNAITCSITLDVAYDPVICPCGHLFDREAIRAWLIQHGTCPVSRRLTMIADLTRCNVAATIIAGLGITRNHLGTDVAETTESATQTEELTIERYAPFIAVTNIPIAVTQLPADSIDILGSARMACVEDGLLNPHSGEITNMVSYFKAANSRVLDTLHPRSDGRFHYLAIRKYHYTHRSADTEEVAYSLSRDGFLVYDLFQLRRNINSYSYVLYSIEWMSHRRPNKLPLWRRA